MKGKGKIMQRNFKILGSALAALALTVGVLAPTAEAAGEIPDIVPEWVGVKDPKVPEKPEVPDSEDVTPEDVTPEEPQDIIPEEVSVKDPEVEKPKVETPDSEGEDAQKHGGLEDPSKPQDEEEPTPDKPEVEKPKEPEVKAPEKPKVEEPEVKKPSTPETPKEVTKVEESTPKVISTVSTPSAPAAPKSTVKAQTGGGIGFGIAGLVSSLVGAFTARKKRD